MDDLVSGQGAIDAIFKTCRRTCALSHALEKAFEELPSVPEQRWIPVAERLPKDDEEVIVSCTDDSGDTPFSYTTVAWHFKGTWICNDERCFFITAWMPLPEPYKERTDE